MATHDPFQHPRDGDGQFTTKPHDEPSTILSNTHELFHKLSGVGWEDESDIDETPTGDTYGFSRFAVGRALVEIDGDELCPCVEVCYYVDDVSRDEDADQQYVVRTYDYYHFRDDETGEPVDTRLDEYIYQDDPMGDGLPMSESEAAGMAYSLAERPIAKALEILF